MSDPVVYAAPNGENRVKGEEIVCPISIGTVAWWQGKKAQEALTHKWTLYVRGANDQDLSFCVKKVVFTLHSSFAEPKREVVVQPFELTEMGWGEFEIAVRLEFQEDVHEEPVELVHRLKLFHDSETQSPSKKPVVSEMYEELVFVEPAEAFWRRVVDIGGCSQPAPLPPVSVLSLLTVWSPHEDLKRLHNVQQRITALAKP